MKDIVKGVLIVMAGALAAGALLKFMDSIKVTEPLADYITAGFSRQG
ncbi:MAG: hypothetical protein WC412_07000 [Candidatus Omnitrophota bacterium]|jgi:hypothetical protein